MLDAKTLDTLHTPLTTEQKHDALCDAMDGKRPDDATMEFAASAYFTALTYLSALHKKGAGMILELGKGAPFLPTYGEDGTITNLPMPLINRMRFTATMYSLGRIDSTETMAKAVVFIIDDLADYYGKLDGEKDAIIDRAYDHVIRGQRIVEDDGKHVIDRKRD